MFSIHRIKGWAKAKKKRLHKNQIEQYILTAAVLTGIAAVFVSTDLCISIVITLFPIKPVYFICLFANPKTLHPFSFTTKADKPYFCNRSLPNCRSPPAPFFREFPKRREQLPCTTQKKPITTGIKK